MIGDQNHGYDTGFHTRLVHAETSTGALQPTEGMADVVHHHGGLLVIDCVTSLGGVPVTVDAWDVDIAGGD